VPGSVTGAVNLVNEGTSHSKGGDFVSSRRRKAGNVFEDARVQGKSGFSDFSGWKNREKRCAAEDGDDYLGRRSIRLKEKAFGGRRRGVAGDNCLSVSTEKGDMLPRNALEGNSGAGSLSSSSSGRQKRVPPKNEKGGAGADLRDGLGTFPAREGTFVVIHRKSLVERGSTLENEFPS